MKVLITGGAGFIGSFIVEEVLNKGWEPIVVDNLITGNLNFVPNNIPFYKLDIRSVTLEQVFQKHQPTVVIHHAAQVSVEHSRLDPAEDCDVNTVGTINILNLCVKYNVSKIIFASSAAVYGETLALPITEEIQPSPLSFYGLSKYTAERYIKLYHQNFNLPYTILRYSNVFGMRQNQLGEAGVISIFLNRINNNQPLMVYGNGQQTRDFIFVRDVAKANIQAVLLGDNETINISTNLQTSIITLAKELEFASNSIIQLSFMQPRMGDIEKSCLSNRKAQNLLKWKPEVSFSKGIQETVEYNQALI